MSQLVLDEQLDVELLPALQKWIKVQLLPDLRPDQRILDDRIPALLQTLKQPTLVTIDQDLWHRRWCHPGYGILYFALPHEKQQLIPDLLRALFRRPEFHTRARRMGKVARIIPTAIAYWQFQVPDLQEMPWQGVSPRRR